MIFGGGFLKNEVASIANSEAFVSRKKTKPHVTVLSIVKVFFPVLIFKFYQFSKFWKILALNEKKKQILEFWKINYIRNNFGIYMPSEISRVSIFYHFWGSFIMPEICFFKKWQKNSPGHILWNFELKKCPKNPKTKVEEHNGPSEFRSSA